MGSSPIFSNLPIIGAVRINAANTARDGSGTLFGLCTGSTNGTRIDTIIFEHASSGATPGGFTPGVGKVFISDSGGTNFRLYYEVLLARVVESNTVIGARKIIRFYNGLSLPPNVVIAVALSTWTSTTDNFDVTAEGGYY